MSGNGEAPEPAGETATAMRYRVRHATKYQYSQPVGVCQNQLRMQPVSGGLLQCQRSDVQITPSPTHCHEHIDYFGNRVVVFSIEAIHQSLEVTVESEVRVSPRGTDVREHSPRWQTLTAAARPTGPAPRLDEHRYRSPRIVPAAAFADYAAASFPPEADLIPAALELTQRIHDDFRYDTRATNVKTPTAEAFKLRAGVCQDFAHVEIACLRSLGLAARYVSGYLRTLPPPGKPRLVGADESHAWLEVHAGESLGWIGLDPTNACLVSTDHIPVCVGRDYDDVSPMRGIVLGGGSPSLSVSVDVAPQSAGDVAAQSTGEAPPT